jgi:transglutaminase-like putative cysteine protease
MYALPSAAVGAHPQVARYARTIMSGSMPLGQALYAVTTAIRGDFAFRSGVTSVRTTLPELLELRAGVCQDFAHLTLGCLRSFGLSARYVSGYIETTAPPGKPKLQGSDATHAWVSVLAPDGGWVDLDPTNSHLADSRYIVTAWGRDYRDVSPLKGVVYTEAASSELAVKVDVTRIH